MPVIHPILDAAVIVGLLRSRQHTVRMLRAYAVIAALLCGQAAAQTYA
jgi:hypothetical protein